FMPPTGDEPGYAGDVIMISLFNTRKKQVTDAPLAITKRLRSISQTANLLVPMRHFLSVNAPG
ncbi:MAG: hypothetical protein H0V31_04780, partial [Acidobacteria bacterium]|nr:hypothetical protein [Acidobacteriota bacterium]